MSGSQFDTLLRSLAASRRAALGGALAAVGWLGAAEGDAKKKRKHKKRKKITQRAGEPNAFGCIDVGDLCQTAEQCCSGICEGKKGTQTCRAHDVGGCQAGAEPEGCGGTDIECNNSNGDAGTCATTTGNAGYCFVSGAGVACTTDRDCQRLDGGKLGPRAACIQCANLGGTVCASIEPYEP